MYIQSRDAGADCCRRLCHSPQADAAYDPVRSLLALAPPRGAPRDDFAAAVLRGLTSAAGGGGRAGGYDLLHSLLRRLAAAAPPGDSEYDPLLGLLRSARLATVRAQQAGGGPGRSSCRVPRGMACGCCAASR